LAITTASAWLMLREIHAGVSCRPPFFSSTLNAATAPLTTCPYSSGAENCGCFGPQNGISTQRVPSLSSHVASALQGPAAANWTSSLHTSGVVKTGVR
jgi:hypothetical protein